MYWQCKINVNRFTIRITFQNIQVPSFEMSYFHWPKFHLVDHVDVLNGMCFASKGMHNNARYGWFCTYLNSTSNKHSKLVSCSLLADLLVLMPSKWNTSSVLYMPATKLIISYPLDISCDGIHFMYLYLNPSQLKLNQNFVQANSDFKEARDRSRSFSVNWKLGEGAHNLID